MGFPIDSIASTSNVVTARRAAPAAQTASDSAPSLVLDTYEQTPQGSSFQEWKADEDRLKTFRFRNAPSSDLFANARNGSASFGQQVIAPSPSDGGRRILTGVGKVVVGAVVTQFDSPLLGPGDVVGAGLISGGTKDIGIGTVQILRSSFPAFPESWPAEDDDTCRRAHALHRAVPRGEKESIEHTGQFTPNPAGSIGKYFYPTQTQAKMFANSRFNNHNPVMWRATGVLPAGTPHDHITPGTEGPAIFVHNPQLSNIKYVRIRERIK